LNELSKPIKPLRPLRRRVNEGRLLLVHLGKVLGSVVEPPGMDYHLNGYLFPIRDITITEMPVGGDDVMYVTVAKAVILHDDYLMGRPPASFSPNKIPGAFQKYSPRGELLLPRPKD
jgi:hypothetical protein